MRLNKKKNNKQITIKTTYGSLNWTGPLVMSESTFKVCWHRKPCSMLIQAFHQSLSQQLGLGLGIGPGNLFAKAIRGY